ncbi:MAG: haloacid dehalogenase [Methanosarcinaceae archaeon]|nr:haloacid dehalogenase [Methanosarcinaceae archaeon]
MLREISARIRENFEEKDRVREEGLKISRQVVRECRTATFALHGQDFKKAAERIEEAGKALLRLEDIFEKHADIYHAGFVEHAQQEFTEASILYELLREETGTWEEIRSGGKDVEGKKPGPGPIPTPETLGMGYAAYLNGLGDVVGELRRHILDLIRRDKLEKAEVFLGIMENIHAVLLDFDYPDAITHGLRRKTDVARSLVEKTRGDLTNAIQQKKLEAAMRELEVRLKEGGPD